MSKLYPEGEFEFTVNGGMFQSKKGNPAWPNHLHLDISKHQAYETICKMLSHIVRGDDRMTVSFVGKMKRLDS